MTRVEKERGNEGEEDRRPDCIVVLNRHNMNIEAERERERAEREERTVGDTCRWRCVPGPTGLPSLTGEGRG